ncbi:MAG: Na(+)-translocating NADH-quinone reductase subunit A [Paracoccus sp. (in: a-proteobacteria)]|uniref:Na(+)-translocating NADH-quinone reductase subunit A n=1 Tax=Paracoccus sp. TaxID=267 RepID=UPI0026DEDF34|nr:Na(+)-translocating NADH-quinone reductase subunit A [Paracoccus sp. (in: a-proteobacteria)]MDO5611787.1 Na(+)-translocating NADH-quinone reductase subunit A [Paracoccus sp. (in: a-proteobacteria)]
MTTAFRSGLALPFGGPATTLAEPEPALTEEAALGPGFPPDFRVDPLVEQGEMVAQGQPVLRDRRHPDLCVTAPMGGRVARIDTGPGRVLRYVLFFRDQGADRHRFDTARVNGGAGVAALMLASGLWTALRQRPFGGFPAPGTRPAAICVMAHDTRPGALPPAMALRDAQDDFARGLTALAGLTDGPLLLVQPPGPPLADTPRLRVLPAGPLHPQGLAGTHIHAQFPARPDAPVWEVDAQEVAVLGALLASGYLPETRMVAVGGPAASGQRVLRCQPGADLHGLAQPVMQPGPAMILSGSALDGVEGRFLFLRDRQVTVMPRPAPAASPHWFRAALARMSRPAPLIPTAALEQALAPSLPAIPFLRALSAGDDDAAQRFGVLSLLETDLALADYVTQADPPLASVLRGMLDRIAAEGGAT